MFVAAVLASVTAPNYLRHSCCSQSHHAIVHHVLLT